MLYQTEPFTLLQNGVATLAAEVDSFSVISATYPDDLEISTGPGGGFFPFPADGNLEFDQPTVVRVKNTNAGANTIEIGSGSAKFRRSLSSGGIVVVAGTVAVTATDGAIASIGARIDTAATTDTGTFSLISLFKRSLQSLTLLISGAVTNAASIVTAVVAVGTTLTALSAKFGALAKTAFALDAANSTNDTLIAAGVRLVYGIDIFNASAGTIYLRLYDKATAPVVGTDVPYRVYAIPTLQSMHLQWAYGDKYSLGLGLGLTAGAGYLDSTVVAAHDAQIVILYE